MYLSKIACVKVLLGCELSAAEISAFPELTFPGIEHVPSVVGNLIYNNSLLVYLTEREWKNICLLVKITHRYISIFLLPVSMRYFLNYVCRLVGKIETKVVDWGWHRQVKELGKTALSHNFHSFPSLFPLRKFSSLWLNKVRMSTKYRI